MKRPGTILFALLVLVPVVVSLMFWQWQQALAEMSVSFDRHAAAYAGSNTCRSCHQDHHASWQRTFHRTMTQEASPHSVQGAFDGQIVEAWGGRMRPAQHDGKYFFEALDSGGAVAASYEVRRAVGSHRYQQYLMQRPDNGQYLRLPLLWHNGDRRWVHMNGAFLYDDHQTYNQHVTTWNHNCIYCHNTGPQPGITNSNELYGRVVRGERVNFLAEARYESKVAELGIACETCHGPGAEHARRNQNPLRRYALHHSAADDPTIVNPRKLDAARATYVCAQCHAQRVPARTELVETWLSSGPTFRAGDDLAQHVRWIGPNEPGPAGNPDLYRLRFWADGTPRLSAYEFQGLSQSKCYQQAPLTCMNCHEAHGGDVHGMMKEGARGNAPCASCHQPIAANLSAHTRHAPQSSGSLCVNCHMPPMVYGVMEIHRSHRIEIPDPTRDHAAERPNACAGCHLDKDSDWLKAQIALSSLLPLAGEGGPKGRMRGAVAESSGSSSHHPHPGPLPLAGEGEPQVAENTRQLLGGDPVQRAVAAKLAGRGDSALSPPQRLRLVPPLLLAMEDGYPAVRRFAWKSLLAILADGNLDLGAAAPQFDFTGTPAQREATIAALRRNWNDYARRQGLLDAEMDPAQVAALRNQAALSAAINIGE